MSTVSPVPGCPYCQQDETLRSFAYPVCSLSGSSLYLFREQSYPGRCLLVLNRHAEEYSQLTCEERQALQEDLYKVSQALEKLYHPGKLNLGVFGDTVRHFHIHIVPKYVQGLDWGGMFQMNPGLNRPSDSEREAAAEQIRLALE